VQYLESFTGRDSSDFPLETSSGSKVDWAAALLDIENTDNMIITVSREKIAREILRLRAENQRCREE
jgi:hypothetical protein